MLNAATPNTQTATLSTAHHSSEISNNPIHTRRVIALLDTYPTLSLPIAMEMVERAAQEPTGIVLAQLEHALDQFDSLPDVKQLSGSQVRVLDVALRQLTARISQLQMQLHHAWEND